MEISVALCTYNGASFIKEQLNSILLQTLPVNEIIICDDGSTDNTINILNEYKLLYPNIIQLYKNEYTLGAKKNFEKAILLCKGDYIFLSDQDDIWCKNKVEIYVEHFNRFPSISVFFSNGKIIDENSKTSNQTLWDTLYFNTYRHLVGFNFTNLFDYILSFNYLVTGAT
ncbi:glycosyltransferase, partial [Hydrotalea sp.]|uniref:glycosyltransferase n=1 Tax=Hydrotalea sp. TaxID=2881279 RepID=UPI003D0E32AD